MYALQLAPLVTLFAAATLLTGCGKPNTTADAQKPKSGQPGKKQSATGQETKTQGSDWGFKRPDKVRGIYLTAWSAGSNTKMEKIYQMFEGSFLNSVVIDIRDEGIMYWNTGIPIAADSNANQIGVRDSKKLFEGLKAHNIYPIARIACFRDNYVTRKHPERAIQDPSGHYWRDSHGNSWLDPYNKDNWDYLAKTVDFALDQGFPEIQLDYVRFPDSSKKHARVCPSEHKFGWKDAKPEDVISAFGKFMSDRIKMRGAYISADLFGIISANKSAHGIGQQLEMVAAPFDAISPMVYPSHFRSGEYNIKVPNAHPYEIITKSLTDFKNRVKTPIRPWLQDFTIRVKGQPLVRYGVNEIKAEIKAAHDIGIDEFLIWNAANRYTAEAYRGS